MIDEIFDRHYQAGRSELNTSLAAALSRFGQSVGNALAVLRRIEEPRAVRRRRASTRVRCN